MDQPPNDMSETPEHGRSKIVELGSSERTADDAPVPDEIMALDPGSPRTLDISEKAFDAALRMLRKAYDDSMAERDREIARLQAAEAAAVTKAEVKAVIHEANAAEDNPNLTSAESLPHSGMSYDTSNASSAPPYCDDNLRPPMLIGNNTAMMRSIPVSTSSLSRVEIQPTMRTVPTTFLKSPTPSFGFDIEGFQAKSTRIKAFWRWQLSLNKFLHSSLFECSMASLIMINAVIIGLELETCIQQGLHTAPVEFRIINGTLTVVFIIELCARVAAGGLDIFRKEERLWIWLDTFVVITSIVELVFDIALSNLPADEQVTGGVTSNAKTIRLVRSMRIIRLSRVLRVTRIVRLLMSLRILLVSIKSTLKSLFWAMTLLLVIIYTYALYIVQATADYLIERGVTAETASGMDRKMQMLLQHWGSVPRCMLSLFSCIANGLGWNESSYVLQSVRSDLIYVFLSFIVFSVFAVLNVMTGVFCQSAIENAQNTEDFRVAALMETQADMILQVRKLFQEIDEDGSGLLTWKELHESWSNEQVKKLFAILGIEPSDLWLLFQLLDIDGSGTIDPEEMVSGCLRLKGAAKAFDVAAVRYEQKRQRVRSEKYQARSMKMMSLVIRKLAQLSGGDGLRSLGTSFGSSFEIG